MSKFKAYFPCPDTFMWWQGIVIIVAKVLKIVKTNQAQPCFFEKVCKKIMFVRPNKKIGNENSFDYIFFISLQLITIEHAS